LNWAYLNTAYFKRAYLNTAYFKRAYLNSLLVQSLLEHSIL
jgi:hypothetical protein